MGNVWHLQSWGDIAFPSSFFLNSSFTGFFPYLHKEETRIAVWRRVTFLSAVQEWERGTWTWALCGALSRDMEHELCSAASKRTPVGLHA